MATSIHKSNLSPKPFTATNELELSYRGKIDRAQVLATQPIELSPIYSKGTTKKLYFADNLAVLATLYNDPAVRGQVQLIYIDPPYSTGGIFESRTQKLAYEDLLEGSQYLEFLRQRLIFLYEILADNGSIYLQLDKNQVFQAKLLLDEIFGAKNFRSFITRKKCNPKNYTRNTYGDVCDYLLFYTKSDDYIWHRPVTEWTLQKSAKEYPCTDEKGRRYKKVPLHAPGLRNGETGKTWRGISPPPGKHWQYTPTRLDEMDIRGEIYWSPTGNPRRKVYLEDSKGIPVQNILLEYLDPFNQNSKITGYPTEKNVELLKVIIEASSRPGDLVLDCFCGSGTTLEAADQLDRRWIGIDNSSQAIATTLRRFQHGTRPMGDFVSILAKPNIQEQFDWDITSSYQSITDFTLFGIAPQELFGGNLLELADWIEKPSLAKTIAM